MTKAFEVGKTYEVKKYYADRHEQITVGEIRIIKRTKNYIYYQDLAFDFMRENFGKDYATRKTNRIGLKALGNGEWAERIIVNGCRTQTAYAA